VPSQVLAVTLVDRAGHRWLLLQPAHQLEPQPAVLDGILQFLEVVQWESIGLSDAAGLLKICCVAASKRGLGGTWLSGTKIYHNIISRVLDTYGEGPARDCMQLLASCLSTVRCLH
jgi:hypothetical protein